MSAVRIEPLPQDFADWDGLLALIRTAFAYMDGLIDPESSAKRLTAEALALKAREERCFVANDRGRIAGCVFASERAHAIYVGKLAVALDYQGKGIGRLLLAAVEAMARAANKPVLELQTRVELTGNQAAFARLGFVETARTAHAGYARPTSITMRKTL